MSEMEERDDLQKYIAKLKAKDPDWEEKAEAGIRKNDAIANVIWRIEKLCSKVDEDFQSKCLKDIDGVLKSWEREHRKNKKSLAHEQRGLF
jgi:predicted metal-dependent phosphoesterase TrpH